MTAVAAYGYTAVAVILLGFGAYAASVLGGHGIACLPRVIAFRAARAVLRIRWAWRCRGRPPVREDGETLTFEETRVLGNLAAGRDVGTRT